MADQADEYRYDVFISYSRQDKAWVRGELLPRLDAGGLKICIDFQDFEAGAPKTTEIERAVTTSRRTLLILTPNYLKSDWAELETWMLQTLDPANRERRLIPLLKAKCDLPLRIRGLTYVNFAEPEDEDLAWRQLLTGLGAPPEPEPPAAPTRAEWHLAHPYPMPPNFTGRAAERELLTGWLEADPGPPLLVLRALGGFGKSALTWHWLLHDVEPGRWPKVVWWSFYETEAGFASFVAETLAYLGLEPGPLGPRQQVDALLRLLHQPGRLLVLDGFERELRAYGSMDAAYRGDDPEDPPPNPLPEGGGRGEGANLRDCVSPLAEHFLRSVAGLPGLRGKVVMTTRLLPRVLETHGDLLQGCRDEELTQLQPADAVAFFRSQGILGSRAEIEAACQPYGYHPLSLRLLAGLVANDLHQPGDIKAARRLDVSGDLRQRRHHVLAHAYDNLTPARQQLLSRIACFRGPVDYEALHALAESQPQPEPPVKPGFFARLFGGMRPSPTQDAIHQSPVSNLQLDLRNLMGRGLLHHDRTTGRYDLHPIVRRYAYDRLGDKTAAHARLRDYLAAVPEPERVQRLEDLSPVIELYHHTVRAGQYDAACDLFYERLDQATYFQFGAYQLQIELLRALFPDGEEHPPRLEKESDQAWTLNALAGNYNLSGQPRRAGPLVEGYITIHEKRGDKKNLAVGLGNLATQQMIIGALQAAEANLRRRIELGREIDDESNEAMGHQELGRLLAYRGVWAEAAEELKVAYEIADSLGEVQILGLTEAYRALRAMLLARAAAPVGAGSRSPLPANPVADALTAARRALELADEWHKQVGRPKARDYVRAYWLLGATQRANGQLDEADRHVTGALTRCRGINLVEMEADILLDLARLRAAQGETVEALQLAQEALLITARSEHVLQGADVQLFLAEMALAAGDQETARRHAWEARQLATCDGPPDYTYQVAYEEAGSLLEQLGAAG